MNNIGIIVNTRARNFSALGSWLEVFRQNNLAYTLYECEPCDLNKTLKTKLKKHSTVLIGGGDGSIRCAAQYCMKKNKVMGVLPLGTLNHFAKELALPATAQALVDAVLKKHTIKVDLAEVNGQVFVNNSSIGFYPSFAKKRDQYARSYNKWLSYIPGLFKAMRFHPSFKIHIKNKSFKHQIKTSFLMVSNNLYSFEFPLTIERESFRKASLGIYFFKHGKLQWLKLFRYFREGNFEILQTKTPVTVTVSGREKLSVSLDGETMTLNSPLIYKSRPQALSLITALS